MEVAEDTAVMAMKEDREAMEVEEEIIEKPGETTMEARETTEDGAMKVGRIGNRQIILTTTMSAPD